MDLSGGPRPEFGIPDMWSPVTPIKNIPTRRQLVIGPSYCQRSQSYEPSWHDPGLQAAIPPWELSLQNGVYATPNLHHCLQDLNGSQAVLEASASGATIAGSVNSWPPKPGGNALAAANNVIQNSNNNNNMLPVPPFCGMNANQLLFNGKVFLPKYQSPDACLPNLNSFPETAMSFTGDGSIPSYLNLMNPEKCSERMLYQPQSLNVTDLANEHARKENLMMKEVVAEASFSNLIGNSMYSCFQNRDCVKDLTLMSAEISPHQLTGMEKGLVGGEEYGGIDLNEASKQKPKRKKHRPKVITEGKPARTPKKGTPVIKTPKSAQDKENTPGKRKYTRRKKDATPSLDTNALGEIVDAESRSWTKSVRRSLNFDSESQSQSVDKFSFLMSMFMQNINSYDQEACDDNNLGSTGLKETVDSAMAQGPIVENSLAGIVFDLKSLTGEPQNEYLKILQSPMISTTVNQNDEASNNIVNSKSISDAPPRGTKRDSCLTDEAWGLAKKSLIPSFNGEDHFGLSHDAERKISSLQGMKKRIRMESNGSECKSSPKLIYTPTTGWKTIQPSNDFHEFTFAKTMKFLTPEQSQTLKLSKESDVYAHNCHVLSNSMSSLSELMGHNRNSSPVNPSSHKNNCMCQPPTPDKPSGYSNSQESKICGTVMLFETSEDVNKPVKARVKTRKKREENSLVNTCPPPSSARSSHGQINPGIIETTPRHFHGNNLHPEVISFNQDDTSKQKALTNSSISSLSSYMNFIDYIVLKLRCLNINKDQVHCQEHNAIIPYAGHGGAIIPYEDTLEMVKRRRPRAKVDLDPETTRVWKLLMGIEQQGNEGASVDKELWWEEERKVFRGRVDSFIARMHLVQGDRRFSQWKGSVVDSVIGVFLTQNVSDHLSSSAFMALAAKFPLRSEGHSKDFNVEKINIPKENQNECIEPLTGTPNLKRNISDHELCSHASLEINTAKKESKKETSCSNQSFGSGTGSSSVVNCAGKSLDSHDTELSVSQESPNSGSNTGVTVARSINSVDIEDKRLVEEAISSQNYVVSSQNFMGYPSSDQISSNSMLNIETDEFLIGSTSNGCGHSSFTELLHMAESNKFQELYCNGCMPFAKSKVIHKTTNRLPFMDQMDHLKGACQPYQAEFTSHHSLVGLSGILPVSQFLYPSYPSKSADSENNASTMKEEIISLLSTTSEIPGGNKFDVKYGECIGSTADNSAEPDSLTKLLLTSRTENAIESYVPKRILSEKQPTFLETKVGYNQHSFSQKIIGDRTDASSNIENSNGCSNIGVQDMAKSQQKNGSSTFKADKSHEAMRVETQMANYTNPMKNLTSYSKEQNKLDLGQKTGSIQKDEAFNYQKALSETPKQGEKAKRKRTESEKNMFDWDSLRKDVHRTKPAEERNSSTMDSLDWEAVRSVDVSEIAETIRERGMNNMLAQRIKDFLNRLVLDHGSIDLEWLRDVPPDKSKDYLLSIRGLGLKSAECVRLLTLHHLAFPVDTNVGRICVRLGWVPLQPLPESLQLHLLEMYPMLETIQKYLWPRLCKLDQRTLYELHYQMITFGKVFCTKSKPNCNACPMRGECRHFASAFASARLALPAPEDKSIVSSTNPIASKHEMAPTFSPTSFPQLECGSLSQELSIRKNSEPIIEEPTTPEPECPETLESEIEDAFFEDPDEIPVIKLNFEKFTQNLQNYMQENMELQATDMSKALVALNPEAASIPMPKLKNISRLRTEHQVYEIPDSHPLLEGFDQREPDDPCPYLLAIWSPGETAQSTEPPKSCCNSQDVGKLCDSNACYACNSIRESQAHKVRGTLLIPCRTAMRGSFPLNGTYFQVNEVFADHHTSRNPIDIPRDWIWNLSRRTVCFGTSIPTIFRGLTTEGIQQCFWRGFVCVRGFDRVTRAPKPLYARLHFPASKATKHRKGGAAAMVDE